MSATTPRWARTVFVLAATAFLVTAGVHLVRAVAPPVGDTSTPPRHVLFIVINLLAAAGTLRRPRWFALPFALLVAQQLSSHGLRALEALRAGAAPGVEDALVTLFLPTVLALLSWDARKPRATESGATTSAG